MEKGLPLKNVPILLLCPLCSSLGNIHFIGELYKLKMLTARVIHECVKRLLKEIDEESLESLCRLLTTLGKELELETNSRLVDARANSVSKLEILV